LVAEAAGHREEAEREYKEAIARAPRRPEPHFYLGSFYLVSGRPAEAVECFQTVLRLDPGNAQTQELLARARRRAAHSQDAEKSPAQPGL
jgi:predicted Zn-dependent protease